MLSRAVDGKVLRGAGLTFFGVCAVGPILWCVGYAALYSVGLTGLLATGFTLEHWHAVLTARETAASFAESIYVASATVALTTGLALGFALGLQGWLRRGVLGYIAYFPLALPGTVAAFLTFQLLSGAGLVSRFAHALGWVTTPAQFPGLIFDPAGVGIIFAHTLIAVPFFTLLFAGIYERENVGQLNALASTLGAGRLACLIRVTAPLLLDRASTNLALFFLAVLGSFEIPLLLGPQSPQMISVLVRRKFGLYDLEQKPQAFIVALLYTALVLALLGLFLRRKPAASTL